MKKRNILCKKTKNVTYSVIQMMSLTWGLCQKNLKMYITRKEQIELFFLSLSFVFVPWFHSSLKFLQMYFNLSDSQKCNIYSKHSSSKPWSWNYSQYKKRLPKLQRGLCTFYVYVGWRRRRRRFFASNENRVHLFTHAISLDFHSRSRFYSSRSTIFHVQNNNWVEGSLKNASPENDTVKHKLVENVFKKWMENKAIRKKHLCRVFLKVEFQINSYKFLQF